MASSTKITHELISEAVAAQVVTSALLIGTKEDFWYYGILNWFLNLVYSKKNKDMFLRDFWTTIGSSIAAPVSAVIGVIPQDVALRRTALYVSDAGWSLNQWDTILHELEHVRQASRWTTPLFAFLYLFPLSLGGLLLLTCWLPVFWASGWHLALWIPAWAILGGLCFIPQLPDPWRTYWELQAYTLSLYCYWLQWHKIDDAYIERRLQNFTDMTYYMMEPRKAWMKNKLTAIADAIVEGTHPVKDHPLVKVLRSVRQ